MSPTLGTSRTTRDLDAVASEALRQDAGSQANTLPLAGPRLGGRRARSHHSPHGGGQGRAGKGGRGRGGEGGEVPRTKRGGE